MVGWFPMDLGLWYDTAAEKIASQLAHMPMLSGTFSHGGDNAVHLAVLVEPFLGYILEGSKRVESRFSTVRTPPFRAVREGDLLLLKEAAGPIVAATFATEVWCYASLTARTRDDLRTRFGLDLRDDVPGFWEQRERARYATLIRLGEVATLNTPIDCPKTDRRGWVVLRERPRQLGLFA
jgi:hypothetical protein